MIESFDPQLRIDNAVLIKKFDFSQFVCSERSRSDFIDDHYVKLKKIIQREEKEIEEENASSLSLAAAASEESALVTRALPAGHVSQAISLVITQFISPPVACMSEIDMCDNAIRWHTLRLRALLEKRGIKLELLNKYKTNMVHQFKSVNSQSVRQPILAILQALIPYVSPAVAEEQRELPAVFSDAMVSKSF